MIRNTAFSVIALICVGASSAAKAGNLPNTEARRFTLSCESQRPNAPFRTFLIDVNLEQRSYFVDTQFGGLDEVETADEHKILFRRHGHDTHGLPFFFLNQYDRANGHWYETIGSDGPRVGAKPDAICKIIAPREHFMADQKYNAEN